DVDGASPCPSPESGGRMGVSTRSRTTGPVANGTAGAAGAAGRERWSSSPPVLNHSTSGVVRGAAAGAPGSAGTRGGSEAGLRSGTAGRGGGPSGAPPPFPGEAGAGDDSRWLSGVRELRNLPKKSLPDIGTRYLRCICGPSSYRIVSPLLK